MTCPHCQKKLRSVIKYFAEHQAIELNDHGEITETGPKHNDGTEDIACGHCLQSLTDSDVGEIRLLLGRLFEC